MSRKGNCWDNQPMEYFFGGLKDHIRLLVAACTDFEEVVQEADRYIRYYNDDRYQWKLAKLAPLEFYRFCTTGVYPLPVSRAPACPKPLKTAEELEDKARRILAEKNGGQPGAGTEAGDSTLGEAPDVAPQSGQRLPD